MPIFCPHSTLFMNKSNFFFLAWRCILNASFQESVQPTRMNDDKENDSRICGVKETRKAYGLAFFYFISYQWNCRIVKTWCQFWCGPVHSVEQLCACLRPRSSSFCPRMPWGTTTELSILDKSGSVLCNYSYFPEIYKQVSSLRKFYS